MAIVSSAGPLPTSVVFEFAKLGDGCDARATVEGSPTGMMQIVEPVIAEVVRTTLAAGLLRAKALLEGEAVS